MKSYVFRTMIEPDDPKGYHGFVPLLSGVHTCGNTIAEVLKNLREAFLCYVQGLQQDGEPIPQEKDVLETVQVFQEEDFRHTYA